MAYNPIIAKELTSLRDKHETVVTNKLVMMAGDHKGGSDGFTPYPFDLSELTHRIDCVGVHGENASSSTLEIMGSEIYRDGYERLFDAFSKNDSVLNRAAETLEAGENIVLGTDHTTVLGLPFGLGALMHALYEEKGFRPDDFESILVVNSMIKHVQVSTENMGDLNGGPTLGMLFSQTAFTKPGSESIKNAGIPDEVRTPFNEASMREVQSTLDADKPAILGVAISGQRDRHTKLRLYRGRPENVIRPALHMRPFNTGTFELVKNGHMLGASIDMRKAKRPYVHLEEVIPPVATEEDLHHVMEQIAEGANSFLTSWPQRIYYRTRAEYDAAIELHTKS